MAKEPQSQKEIKATGYFSIIPLKIIVIIDGFAVGPFDTGPQALAWAMEHSKSGIYELKELLPPHLEI